QSDEIAQITANMFGLPVIKTQTHEAAVIGSAALAFTGIKRYENIDDALDNMIHVKNRFEPDMEEHDIYRKLYSDIYCKIFDKLRPLYDRECELEEI
ncbi:MAG TPA: FGGY-family carbohydrate kinase, partial [Anaerovoracaceae bacterium]|nr:FGGY-family carbohydrate kinase [Anaerovoracaceae bacterium]